MKEVAEGEGGQRRGAELVQQEGEGESLDRRWAGEEGGGQVV